MKRAKRFGWLWSVAAACGLLAGGSQSAWALDVALKVQETAGAARVADPCRSGIPLAPGAVKDETKLRVLDEKGAEVPAQFRVMQRRPGGDIEWVCVDFLADAPANGAATYHLTDSGPGKIVDKPVAVDDAAESLTITNGPLKFAISKKSFGGLGQVWLDRDGDGKFADDELVAKGGGLTIEGMDGKVYRSATDLTGPLAVTLEEQGPLHVVVRIDGEMKAQSKDGGKHTYPGWLPLGEKQIDDIVIPNADRSLGFTTRVHIWKGQSWVRAFVTARVLNGTARSWFDPHREEAFKIQYGCYFGQSAQKPGNFLTDAVNFDLDLPTAGELSYRIGGGVKGDQVHAGKLAPQSPGVTLYQDSPADWSWQAFTGQIYDPVLKQNVERMKALGKDKPFTEYVFSATQPSGKTFGQQTLLGRDGFRFIGYRLLESAREIKPGDSTCAADLGKPIAEGMRAPGWLEASDGKTNVTVGCRWFWQMCPKSLEVRPGRLTVGLWPREFSRGHLFEGTIHRTHELVIDFQPAGPNAIAAERRFAAFDARLMALPDGRHNLACGVYGDFPLYPMKDWPNYEKSAMAPVSCELPDDKTPPAFVSSMELEREKYSSYGVWNFGDCAEVTWHLFAQYHEADMPYCLLLQLARTGDLRLYREAELLDRHLLDIPAHGGGYGHPQGTWLHYYTLGPLLFSCITGEPWMKDAVEQSHRNTPPLATRLDTTGIAIWANLDMRLHFPRQQAEHTKALDTAVAHWRELIDPKTSLYKQCDPPLESVHHVPIGLDQHYWFGIVGDAIGRYCETFPESKDDRDRLAKVCRAWMKLYGDAPADVQLNTMWLPGGNAMAYASRFTGDSAFLDFAAKNWVLDSKFHPRYRTGSSSAKNWSAFGHRLTQVFLHDWDKRQHPEKYNQDDREPH